MTTRTLIIVVGLAGVIFAGAVWAYFTRTVAIERAAALQEEQRHRVEEPPRAFRFDAGPCLCQPADPLCACL